MNTVSKELFKKHFLNEPTHYAECGGRFEIIGNHTDHNHGLCLAATCDLKIFGFCRENQTNFINVQSVGYKPFNVDVTDLRIRDYEKSTSKALVRGICRYFKDHGYNVGGFDLLIDSTIYSGAGVSSSAAFESLIAKILSALFNNNEIAKIDLARAGAYSENEYFGKKCGLLDQIGTGFGNVSCIDFENMSDIKVGEIAFPFDDLKFVIVNTGGSHAGLDSLYSAIPQDMWNASKKAGVNFLRETTLETILATPYLTEYEKNRAIHFYGENERVQNAKEALLAKDKAKFLEAVNGSRYSSTNYLKNMMVGTKYEGSPLEAADYAMEFLKENGACKINGGGFAGSIICVVPTNILDEFVEKMAEKYTKENVRVVTVNPLGAYIEKL